MAQPPLGAAGREIDFDGHGLVLSAEQHRMRGSLTRISASDLHLASIFVIFGLGVSGFGVKIDGPRGLDG